MRGIEVNIGEKDCYLCFRRVKLIDDSLFSTVELNQTKETNYEQRQSTRRPSTIKHAPFQCGPSCQAERDLRVWTKYLCKPAVAAVAAADNNDNGNGGKEEEEEHYPG